MSEEENNRLGHRTYKIVGPLLLIFVGLLMLMNQLGLLSFSWQALLRLSPLLLILFGLEMLLGRSQTGAIIVLIIALLVMGGTAYWVYQGGTGQKQAREMMHLPLQRAREAHLEVTCDTCALEIEASPEMTELIEAKTFGHDIDLTPHYEQDGQRVRVVVDSDSTPMIGSIGGERWQLELNPDIPLTLDIKSGIGSTRLDLSQVLLQELILECGIGNAKVYLPEGESYSAKISAGIGNIEIHTPQESAVRVRIDGGLQTSSLSSRFSRQGAYYIANGSTAEESVAITIEAGIGKIVVH